MNVITMNGEISDLKNEIDNLKKANDEIEKIKSENEDFKRPNDMQNRKLEIKLKILLTMKRKPGKKRRKI